MASSVTEEFSGKVAIVTGSGSGFGEAITLTFAKRGAKVTLCDKDVTRLEKVKDKCVAASGGQSDRFLTVCGDLCDQETRSRIVNSTVAQFGQLDILVLNAGVFHFNAGISDATEESFDYMFDVNVKANFFMVQTALPQLEKSKGNIVVTSSNSSQMAWSPVNAYPMTKAAVDHMVNCLALDLAPKGIRVNTVNPSYTITRLVRVTDDEEDQQINERAQAFGKVEEAKQPLENRLVTTEEVSEAVAFLASDKASFITGQHLFVDGGRKLTGPYST